MLLRVNTMQFKFNCRSIPVVDVMYLQTLARRSSTRTAAATALLEVVQELQETDEVGDERLLFLPRLVRVGGEGREGGAGLGEQDIPQLPVLQGLQANIIWLYTYMYVCIYIIWLYIRMYYVS